MNVMSSDGQIQDGSYESLRQGDFTKLTEDRGWELHFMESASFLDFYLTGAILLCAPLFKDMLKTHVLWYLNLR